MYFTICLLYDYFTILLSQFRTVVQYNQEMPGATVNSTCAAVTAQQDPLEALAAGMAETLNTIPQKAPCVSSECPNPEGWLVVNPER